MYTQADTDALGRALTVTVNGLTQTTTPTDYTASTFIKGQNYLEFNATTDNSGALLISYMSAPGTAHKEEADINGIQLASAPTPEPSTLVLMGIGGLLVAFRFRKSGAGAGSILSA